MYIVGLREYSDTLLEGARPHASALLSLAEELRHVWGLASAYFVNELLAQLKGDWEAARIFGDSGLAAVARDVRLLHHRAILEHQVGNHDQGEPFLERLVEAMHLSPPGPALEYARVPTAIASISRIQGTAGRFDVAESAAETVLSSPSSNPHYAIVAQAGLGLIAVERGDMVSAAERYAALQPHQGTMLFFGLISVDRLLALLAQTMGRREQAAAHFEDALSFCRQAGYRAELAWTCYEYGDALLESAKQTDGPEAEDGPETGALLDEALAISEELGMRPLGERVVSHRESIES